jgi:predicted O-linked N-acetylglucosamine transferase (SPINDLY family)
MGTAKNQEGDHAAAIHFLERTLDLEPAHVATHSNLGIALKHIRFLEKALASQRNALVLDPSFFDGIRNLAMCLQELSRDQEALNFLQFALQVKPDNPEALSLYGVILGALHRTDEAAIAHKKAIAQHPSLGEALNNLGVALLQSMKTSAALTITHRSLVIQPKNPEGWLNLGTLLLRLGHNDRALHAFEAAITLQPHEARGYLGRAATLKSDREFRLAAGYLERAIQLAPEMTFTLVQAAYCRSKAFEWGPMRDDIKRIKKEIADGHSIDNPFPLLTCLDDSRLHLLAARSYTRKAYPEIANDAAKGPQAIQGKIRIGYFTSDLDVQHPVLKNLYPLIEQHDRSRFALFCFDNSRSGEVVVRELFDEVVHVRSMTAREIAALARQKNIHIAIDLNGHTEDGRTDVFAARAAPLQINFLGYPGSMGSTYHDFIIADDYVIPMGQEHFYSEKILRLPSFFMPYDFLANRIRKPVGLQRKDYGLPEEGFIYCSFNEFHKITEATFHSWITILKQTEDSVLWLAKRGDIGIHTIQSMMRLAGISPERIIEAHRVESPQEHHARLALADLMLDTFPYNAHTTACDAIFAGLPLLTRAGQSFASRVSGSLLSEIGVPSLIATSSLEYVEKAILLAKEPQHYRAVRKAIKAGVDRIPPPAIYARNFEALLENLGRPTVSQGGA